MKKRLARGFSSLAVRNYRLYFLGQLVSVSGNWMQEIAVAWLVLKLTNSVFALGVSTALQTVPYLFTGVWGGLLADRVPKRRLLICTQVAQLVAPISLWALTVHGTDQVWMVYAIIVFRGFANTVDNPARQSFVSEMVGMDRVVNAVSLNASLVQGGRLVGPAVAAGIIATLGLAACFLVNALTFVFMIAMLLLMRPSELRPAPVTPPGKGQLRAGLAHAARTPELRLPLALMAIVGPLSLNFTVVLPAIARFTYHGTATTYALMMNFLAAGALVGALLTATRTVVTRRMVSWAAVAFGVALAVAASVNTLWIALVAMLAVGAASVTFSASVQSALQLAVEPEMRGRIISLYQIVFKGMTPLGALIIGTLAAVSGARSGLVAGAVAALAAGAGGLWRRGKAGDMGVAVAGPSEQGA